MGPGILYTSLWFENLLSGNIVYNELAHENIKHLENHFFESSEKNINLLKTEMGMHDTALSCHIHIYLSSRTLKSQINSVNTAHFVLYFHGPLHYIL